MLPVDILLLAVGLAMDATVVSAAAGASGRSRGGRATFRLGFHFGLFQFLMPIIGWFVGLTIAGAIAAVDHWIAFVLLAVVGGRMIQSGLKGEDDTRAGDPSKGMSLIMLSIATSIDALAVGISLAALGVDIWYPSIVVGVLTASLSLLGIYLGARIGDRFGKVAEVAGGLLLIAIGIRIFLEHTLA
jgi:putative Mn2+ efflux pump MntP